ncbi:hypothetical protein [Dactylococcopsis salina]|uniref:hypothetical protein n=1 Tax=Dactylococcopsis salina TaxID=292566 RepID=UPI00090062CE|nr:hypothetical protein [Dactylococcopsis salina]
MENDRVLRSIDRLHFLPMLGLGAISYGFGGLDKGEMGDKGVIFLPHPPHLPHLALTTRAIAQCLIHERSIA